MNESPTLHLKKGCAKPLHSGHPWVFADAIARLSPDAAAGDEVRVVDDRGACLGRGFYSPNSAIAVRILTRDDAAIDTSFIEKRIDEAVHLRHAILKLGERSSAGRTTAYRLINSEGDGLGGLTVDVYGEYLTVQIGTVGMDRSLDTILDVLEHRLNPKAILDRSDTRIRSLEKLTPPKMGALRGVAPEAIFTVHENNLPFNCDLRAGHSQKTGLYLDQRDNRRLFGSFAAGRNILDVFSYSGGFALHAIKNSAKSITLIESSTEALELARANLELNGVEDADLIEAECDEGFKHLRQGNRLFELIVLDPPKFSRSREQSVQALSAYRALNSQAVRLLAPGGILFSCSCSGTVSDTDFERAVAGGIHAAGRRAVLLERRGAASDHPIPPGFDQGRYLKCLVLQIV